MAAVNVKQEPLDASDVDARLIFLCQQNSRGVSEEVILSDMPFLKGQPLADAINRLMKKNLLSLHKNPQTQKLIYKFKSSASEGSSTTVLKGASQQENLVYQIIQDAGNKGIWRKEIHRRSGNLPQQEFDKILKSLEGKKLVKQVSSVQASRKKVYMLYSVQPDRSVTGGSWYTDQDFDSQFVDTLIMMCHRFLEQKAALNRTKADPLSQRNGSFAASREVWKYISDSGISTHPLTVEDIESILDTLVYDGKVAAETRASTDDDDGAVVQSQSVRWYRCLNAWCPATGITRLPCAMCPYIGECHSGGVISPEACEYIKDWLDT